MRQKLVCGQIARLASVEDGFGDAVKMPQTLVRVVSAVDSPKLRGVG